MATHQHGFLGEAGESDSAQNTVRLDGNIVIHVEDERRGGVLAGLIHDAAVSAGATQVALLKTEEATIRGGSEGFTCCVGGSVYTSTDTEMSCGSSELGVVDNFLCALVRHQDSLNDGVHVRVGG